MYSRERSSDAQLANTALFAPDADVLGFDKGFNIEASQGVLYQLLEAN